MKRIIEQGEATVKEKQKQRERTEREHPEYPAVKAGNEDEIAKAQMQNKQKTPLESFVARLKDIFKSWSGKEDGEKLTKQEADLQAAIGAAEMVGGAVGGIGGCAASNGGSVPLGLYVMGDGGNVIGGALRGDKVTPFKMLVDDFLVPNSQIDGDIYFVSPLP